MNEMLLHDFTGVFCLSISRLIELCVQALRRLVRLAKARWKIEQDYQQITEELGLDHYEGRYWVGWHHHVTLVMPAQPFLHWRHSGLNKLLAETSHGRATKFNTCCLHGPALAHSSFVKLEAPEVRINLTYE